MQIINHWPDKAHLALPAAVKQTLVEHLIEPFGDEDSAKDFWQEYPSTIFILSGNDTKASLLLLDDATQHQITFALEYPEYTEYLALNFMVNLSVINDEGNGIYLVIHPDSEFYHKQGESND